jgi:hypothetical protein
MIVAGLALSTLLLSAPPEATAFVDVNIAPMDEERVLLAQSFRIASPAWRVAAPPGCSLAFRTCTRTC